MFKNKKKTYSLNATNMRATIMKTTQSLAFVKLNRKLLSISKNLRFLYSLEQVGTKDS